MKILKSLIYLRSLTSSYVIKLTLLGFHNLKILLMKVLKCSTYLGLIFLKLFIGKQNKFDNMVKNQDV
jgi:hypothetical protein